MPTFLTPLLEKTARAFRKAHQSSFLCHPAKQTRAPFSVPMSITTMARELITRALCADVQNYTLEHSILYFVDEVLNVRVGGEAQRRRMMRLEDHPNVSRLIRLVLVAVVKWAIDSNAGFLFVAVCGLLIAYLKGWRPI